MRNFQEIAVDPAKLESLLDNFRSVSPKSRAPETQSAQSAAVTGTAAEDMVETNVEPEHVLQALHVAATNGTVQIPAHVEAR